MPALKRKIMISVFSFVILCFLCYGAFPRSTVAVFGDGSCPSTLVIDPGHGGPDGGAVSKSGVREADLNLQISFRLRDLAVLTGLPVLMTREADISLHDADCKTIASKKLSDLRNRVRFIGSQASCILISVHQNHFPQEKYHGAQVFFAQNVQSSEIAKSMQDNICKYLDKENRRKPKPAQGIYLMQHVTCPAVLLECGFLSNEQETQMLQNDTYQKKLALTVLRTITQTENGGFEFENENSFFLHPVRQ